MRPIALLIVLLALATIAVPAPAVTFVVAESGGDYIELQAAVDAAGTGDTIEVRQGTYSGGVIVAKPLSITGSGDDCRVGTPEDEYALFVTSEGVAIHDLRLWGSDVALSLNGAHSAFIEGCRVEEGERGILIVESQGVAVSDSDVSADFIAIEATNASQILITGTRIFGATQGLVLQSSDDAVLRDNRIEDCGIGVFVRASDGGSLEGTAFSRVRGGVALLMAADWTISRSTLESVDQFLDACMSSGCLIEAASLDGPAPFASDAVSANRYDIGTLRIEGRDFSLSADGVQAPEGYVQYGEGFGIDFLDVSSTAGSMVSVEMDAGGLGLNGTEPGTLGFYRIDGTGARLAATDADNGTVAAVILEPGTYALMAKTKAESGTLLPVLALIAVIVVVAFLFLKKRREGQ